MNLLSDGLVSFCQAYYPFYTKVAQVLDQSRCLLWNQFFVFQQPKDWLSSATNALLVLNKEPAVSGAWPDILITTILKSQS